LLASLPLRHVPDYLSSSLIFLLPQLAMGTKLKENEQVGYKLSKSIIVEILLPSVVH
jgi:hypothetical protein